MAKHYVKLAQSTHKVLLRHCVEALKCVLLGMGLNKPLENFFGATRGSFESWRWLGCGLEMLPIHR